MEQNLDIDSLSLEEPCPNCNGDGGWLREEVGGWRRCDICNGSGYTVTTFGEKVLALMRHNFKPMLQDAKTE